MASWQRFYLGYHGRFQEDVELVLPSGRVVAVAQSPSASKSNKGKVHESKVKDPSLTGTTVWDGSICLAMTLCSSPSLINANKGNKEGVKRVSMIELGAGCALVSLAVAAERLVSSVCITDLAEMLPSIERQVSKNAQVLSDLRREGDPVKIDVRALKWGPEGKEDIAAIENDLALYNRGQDRPSTSEESTEEATTANHFDIIVGADLIYYSYSEATPHTKLLLFTLKRLSGPSTIIFLALSLHHNPDEVNSFLKQAAEVGFLVDQLMEQVPEEYRVDDVMVVRLRPAR